MSAQLSFLHPLAAKPLHCVFTVEEIVCVIHGLHTKREEALAADELARAQVISDLIAKVQGDWLAL